MRERPILFSAPMVRAILAGTKTMTRRVVKPQPEMVSDKRIEPWNGDPDSLMRLLRKSGRKCPYGQPGDRLWVRETHAPRADCMAAWDRSLAMGSSSLLAGDICYQATTTDRDWVTRWRPSIHMPRWASRITLEITDVRVERTQDISAEDCIAEGLSTTLREHEAVCHLHEQYRDLLDSINGAGSWDANDWVWVVSFKRVEVRNV